MIRERNSDHIILPGNTLDLTAIALMTDGKQKAFLQEYVEASGSPLYVYVRGRQYTLTIDHSLCLQSTDKPPHRLDVTTFCSIEATIAPPQAELIDAIMHQLVSQSTASSPLTDTQHLIIQALAMRNTPPQKRIQVPLAILPLAVAPTGISHHKILRLVRCEIIDICLNLINEQTGPQLSPFGSVRKAVRIYDRETVLIIKTANSIAFTNRAPLDQTKSRFEAALHATTRHHSLPKGRIIQRNALHNGLVTHTYSLAIPSQAKANMYPGNPHLEFSTLAEELFDQVDAISTWQVEDHRSKQSAPFKIGHTFAVKLSESTHTIHQNLYWDIAIHSC